MEKPLSEKDRSFLLSLARQTIEKGVSRQPLPVWNEAELSEELSAIGASFVTLTLYGELKGCIGTLETYQPLVQDVRDHAIQAALEDNRFRHVTVDEVPKLHIEISRLTPAKSINYENPGDLPGLLHPGEDGVILKDGYRRATFLPQVWEQLPEKEEFLSHLCLKMGSSADLWKRKVLELAIYHVEEFQEAQ
jgi:uncharacterized protein